MSKIIGLSVGEDFAILACVVLTQYQCVTDRRKGRDMPTIAIAVTAFA